MNRTSQLMCLALFSLVFSMGCSEKRSVAPEKTTPEPAAPSSPASQPIDEAVEAE